MKEMIAAAAEAGADFVKMQSIFSQDLSRRERFEEGETNPDGSSKTIKRPYTPEKERLSKLDLTEEDHLFFIEECKAHGVTPFTTIFSRGRIPSIATMPWPGKYVKVASYDCASFPMLRELSARFDHLLVSTGATEDGEIATAADILRKSGKPFSFLHCVTSYPNTLEMCNLARMQWLRTFTPSVGWSDHTLLERDGLKASKAAIALGADWVERHFTILEKDETKDGPVSVRPKDLRELREFSLLPKDDQLRIAKADIPEWDVIIGQATRNMTPTELRNRDYYRGRFETTLPTGGVQNWEEKPAF